MESRDDIKLGGNMKDCLFVSALGKKETCEYHLHFKLHADGSMSFILKEPKASN